MSKTVKFEFSLEETNTLLVALAKLPLEVSVGLWAKMKEEAEKQLRPVEGEKKDGTG